MAEVSGCRYPMSHTDWCFHSPPDPEREDARPQEQPFSGRGAARDQFYSICDANYQTAQHGGTTESAVGRVHFTEPGVLPGSTKPGHVRATDQSVTCLSPPKYTV